MSKTNNVSTYHYELFYTLINCGSFTGTATHIGISKAAVSQSIKALEGELKVKLINRTTRSMSLTHEGELLYEQCEYLHRNLAKIKETTDAFHDKPSGTLKIGGNSFFANTILPQAIKEYQRRFPLVNVEVIIEEIIHDFKDDSIDLIFGVSWSPHENLVARKISNTRYILCASQDYLTTHGTPGTLDDLARHTHVTHKGRSSNLVCLKDAEIIPPIDSTIISNDAEFIKNCVLNGLGIGQLHEYLVREEIKNGKLVPLLEGTFENEIGIFMYYEKDKFVKPKVREFVAIALDECKKV